jgi:ribosome-associated protein
VRGEPLVVGRGIVIPAAELDLSFTRAGGPGGQNVNKVASRAVVRFDVAGSPSLPEPARRRALARLRSRLTDAGELVLASSEHREQARNRAAVLARLAEVLAAAVRPVRPRKATKTPAAARERRLAAKRARGERLRDRSVRD